MFCHHLCGSICVVHTVHMTSTQPARLDMHVWRAGARAHVAARVLSLVGANVSYLR